MLHRFSIFAIATVSILGLLCSGAGAGPRLLECAIPPHSQRCDSVQQNPKPQCGVELTCTDKPVQLGYSDGVCFRATCPGIWAVLHRRVDQSSFRRRIWTYSHYTFTGYWSLKDQGAIQSSPVQLREVFLVMPDDLIEFRLRDCDQYARVELRNLGYIKRGDLCELKKWLAEQSYQLGPALIQADRDRIRRERENSTKRWPVCGPHGPWPFEMGEGFFRGLLSICSGLGLPF